MSVERLSSDSIRRAQTALREAMARMDAAWAARDIDHFYAGVVESAVWLVSLDDYLSSGDAGYRAQRDTDDGGRIVAGLRWVRNAAVHSLVEFHETQPDRTYPRVHPVRYETATWKKRSEITDRARSQPGNEAAYDRWVAGQPVQRTLGTGRDFLWMRATTSPGDIAASWQVRPP